MLNINLLVKNRGLLRAFTLIEVLVIIAISVAILTFAVIGYNGIRAKSRDAQRIDDIKQIQAALSVHKQIQGFYPPALQTGQPFIDHDDDVLMKKVPVPPKVEDGKNCAFKGYQYISIDNGLSYELYYCLGSGGPGVVAGTNIATPRSLSDVEALAELNCVPETDLAFCASKGANCGGLSEADNCGKRRNVSSCGDCAGSLICGAEGVANVCGCAKETNTAFCARLNAVCGSLSGLDNCNSTRTVSSCGSCYGTAPYCSNNQRACLAQPDCPVAVCGDGTGLSCGSTDFVAAGSLTLSSANASGYVSSAAYQAVKIGNQCWLSANINIGTVDSAHTMAATNATTSISRYCWQDANKNSTNCDKSGNGGVYTWAMAMYLPASYNTATSTFYTGSGATATHQGLCPKGWHIPSDYEWWYAEDYVQRIAAPVATALASDSPNYYTDQVGMAGTTGFRGLNTTSGAGAKMTNLGSSGLNMTMQGYWSGNSFTNQNTYGYYWSTSQSYAASVYGAWNRLLRSGTYSNLNRSYLAKTYGMSLRCLKD